jgi:hypothetical protein
MLRFSGVIKHPAPQDRFRKFVVIFYLSEDTVAVFELPQRNCGAALGTDMRSRRQVIVRLFGISEHEAMTAVRRWTNDRGFDSSGFVTHLTS